MRKLPILVFLLLAISFTLMLLRKEAPVAPGGTSDAPLPALTLTTLDGKTVWRTDALKGHVTLINFFASWCAPCAAEMPELVALKKQFPDLVIEGVAWNDDPAKIHGWLKQHGNPYARLWLDKTGSATIALGIRGIPESFLIDRQGTVRYRLPAPVTPELRAGELGTTIAEVLHEK